MSASTEFVASLPFLGYKQRNLVLDNFFYDTASITLADNGVSTLAEILLAHPPKLEYLIAHSKGSLVVSHALKQYVEDLDGDESQLFERLRITTLGAVVELPAAFKNVKQYLGTLDWFGSANSSLGVKHERVPGAGHHLNPGFPYHMSVASLLNGGVAQRLLPKPPIAEAFASLAIPSIAAAEPVPMPVKAKDAVRKRPKKVAKPPRVARKMPSAAPKVTSSAAKVASPAAKVASSAPKVTPKAAIPTAKAPVEEVKQPSIAAKPAVNGKLVARKSKREVR
jgi:hypothetical protein